jgi:hypothetical protein
VSTYPPLHHTKGILLTRGDQTSGKRLNPKSLGVKENAMQSNHWDSFATGGYA